MRYVIVGDVHLVRDAQHQVAEDLAGLVRSHRGATLVFAGDLLDLAAESVHEPALPAVRSVLAAHDELRVALAQHVAQGGDVVLVAGNHDQELATDAGREAFCEGLGLDAPDRARVRTTPWFARLGDGGALHVEHGHHFDPDNALPHPLAVASAKTSSLGIGLMHQFVAPNRIHELVHTNQGTPLQILTRAYQLFGKRTPIIVAQYIASSARQIKRAGPRYLAEAAEAAGDALDRFAEECEVPRERLEALLARGARPTLASKRDTFMRLYADRVLATVVLSVAGASALLRGPGRSVALGAASVLMLSVAAGKNRYRGRVHASLVENSAHIAEATGARRVVFGHIHDPVEHGLYKNTGSFAFPGRAPGRPHIIADGAGETRHAFFRAARDEAA